MSVLVKIDKEIARQDIPLLRKRMGMTRMEFARQLGEKCGWITEIENGRISFLLPHTALRLKTLMEYNMEYKQ